MSASVADTVPVLTREPDETSVWRRVGRSAAFLRSVSVLAAIAIWQAVGEKYYYVISKPTAIYSAFFKIFVTDALPAFGRTTQGLAIGFTLCIVAGIPLGARGVRLVPGDLLDVGRSLVAGRIRNIVTIVLPASTRFIYAGIRVGFARAMIGTVVVELEAAPNGVGFILHRYTEQFLYADYFAVVIVLGFYALFFTNVIAFLERWTLEPWRRRRSVARMMGEAPLPMASPQFTRRDSRSISSRVGHVFSGVSRAFGWVTQSMGQALRLRSVAWLVRALTLAVILLLWNWKASQSSAAVLSTPSAVAKALWRDLVTQRNMWPPIGLSFEVLVVGFLISLVVGFPLGIVMGRSRIVEKVLDPYIAFLYALPHAVFIPIMVEWLGFRFNFAVAYVFVSAVFPVIINTMSGVKGTDPNLIDAGRSFCASERKIRSSIVIPAAFPMMLTGARIAFSASWVGVIIAEILTTNTGLGGDIQVFSDEFQTASMYGTIVVIMVIAVILLQLSVNLERRLTPWMPRTAIEG